MQYSVNIKQQCSKRGIFHRKLATPALCTQHWLDHATLEMTMNVYTHVNKDFEQKNTAIFLTLKKPPFRRLLSQYIVVIANEQHNVLKLAERARERLYKMTDIRRIPISFFAVICCKLILDMVMYYFIKQANKI